MAKFVLCCFSFVFFSVDALRLAQHQQAKLLLSELGELELELKKQEKGCVVERSRRNNMDDDGPCGQAMSMHRHRPVTGTDDRKRHTQVMDYNISMSENLQLCSNMVHPLADFDTKSGHGAPECRYEPSREKLKSYKSAPLDIAIVQPHDKIKGVPDFEKLKGYAHQSVYSWQEYARFHGYAHYVGLPEGPCDLGDRASMWIKVCVARQLIRKHKYLIIVDTDTFVTKPQLRMEPLFEKAGLLDEHSGKTVAIATEWGSCNGGRRADHAGDYNGGVYMIKNTARRLVEKWYNHNGYGRHRWAAEQYGFHHEVMTSPGFQKQVTVFPSGCPINGPWGDFIAHLVGGTVSPEYYDNNYRETLLKNARECISNVLAGNDTYARCALCDLLGDMTRNISFSLSCPSDH